MLKHVIVHTQREDRPALNTCDVCGKSFAQASYLKVHMRFHSDVRPFKCHKCERAFRIKADLRKHMTTHKQCPICGEEFSNYTLYRSHMTDHDANESDTNAFSEKCKVCGETFTSKAMLCLHVDTHAKAKAAQCPICHKILSQSSYLPIHMRIHTEDKTRHCQHCSEVFYTKLDLRKKRK